MMIRMRQDQQSLGLMVKNSVEIPLKCKWLPKEITGAVDVVVVVAAAAEEAVEAADSVVDVEEAATEEVVVEAAAVETEKPAMATGGVRTQTVATPTLPGETNVIDVMRISRKVLEVVAEEAEAAVVVAPETGVEVAVDSVEVIGEVVVAEDMAAAVVAEDVAAAAVAMEADVEVVAAAVEGMEAETDHDLIKLMHFINVSLSVFIFTKKGSVSVVYLEVI